MLCKGREGGGGGVLVTEREGTGLESVDLVPEVFVFARRFERGCWRRRNAWSSSDSSSSHLDRLRDSEGVDGPAIDDMVRSNSKGSPRAWCQKSRLSRVGKIELFNT